MSKIEVELPPALADFVQSQVDAGLYHTTSDVIEDVVRRASEEDWIGHADVETIRAALAPGLADVEAGRVRQVGLDEILAKARGGEPAGRGCTKVRNS